MDIDFQNVWKPLRSILPFFPAPIPPPPTPNQQEQITFSQVCTATSCADLQEADFAIKKVKFK